MTFFRNACFGFIVALIPLDASAQASTQIGTLSCDVSRGIGMFVVEKQTLSCVFKNGKSGTSENYIGTIDQFGVALGETRRVTWSGASLRPPAAFRPVRWPANMQAWVQTPRSAPAPAPTFSSAAAATRSRCSRSPSRVR